MREKFYNLNDLLGYYRFVKLQVESTKSILPQKDYEQLQRYNSILAQSSVEERHAFICDVESVVKVYFELQTAKMSLKIPRKPISHKHLLFLFTKRTVQGWSYNRIAMYFRNIDKDGMIPDRMKYKTNTRTIYIAIISFAKQHLNPKFTFIEQKITA